ncbi:hypothetical protein OB2597_09164 [Pseudooceanicola batsensis HTCC2597]|uniref:Uncharacterized protein n=1 Tax=Pseudooceanicola batsensis (strain ATCC BAA-863 / DSM 15984 / KCTC 12145 / HTCC2597) TaxID=252305 RepID=A3TUV5_PSEBH|nr:hypothetical protein OB2597_09164 [Pseudooceanicola batsensis HTCC2597]
MPSVRSLRRFRGQLLGLGFHFVDAADHVEGRFGQVVVLAGDHGLERRDRVFQGNLHTIRAGEDLRHVERLRQEALDLPGAGHGQLVLFRQFVHPEDRDDVLQRLVALKDTLHVTGHLVVFLADDLRVHETRGRVERVHGRVDAKLRDRTVENRRRVEVGEGRGRRRVGQVVRGNVDGLDRGDRPVLGRGDPFLHRAHVGGQRRLVAHGRGNTTQKRRHLRARLSEAEDVVDEEQNVRPGRVAELFRQRQAGKGDPRARTRRFVHLAVDQGDLGIRQVVRGQNARLDHLVVEVVALAGPFAHTGEHGQTRVHLGDVVDQFLDENRLAHTGTAEETDLAALGVGGQQVDHLDAGHEDLGFGRLVGEVGGRRVDRPEFVRLDRALLVDRLADHVQDAAQRRRADRHRDRAVGVGHFLAADQTFGRVHRDGAHGVLTKVLRHFQNQLGAVVVGGQCVEDLRQVIVELHVHNGADDLGHSAFCVCHVSSPVPLERFRARNDFDQFVGDDGLTRAVVLDRELVDHLARVARGVVHRRHPCTLFGCAVFQQRREDLGRHAAGQQVGQDRFLVGLVVVERGRAGILILGGLERGGDDLLRGRLLGHDVLEFRVEDRADVELALFETAQ